MKKILLTSIVLCCISFTFAQSPFTKGNLVIYRYGNGAYGLGGNYPSTNEHLPVFLDEYTKAGLFVQSIPFPTATVGDQRTLTGIATPNQEGSLTRSSDGRYLLTMGYQVSPGAGTSLNYGMPRVISRTSIDGTVNTATATPHLTKGTTDTNIGTPRMPFTNNGLDIWFGGTGSAGGIRYVPFEFNKGLAIPDMENATSLDGTAAITTFGPFIFRDKVYYSAVNAINSFEEALPKTPGVVVKTQALPSTNAFQFVMFDTNNDDAPDLLYATKEINNTTGESSIVKFIYDSVLKVWVAKGEYKNPLINVHSKFLTVELINNNAQIYFSSLGTTTATTAPATPTLSTVYKIENAIGTDLSNSIIPVLIATAAPKTTFRGIAFAPEVIVPTPVKLSSFKGKANGLNSVKLDWSTASEKNNAHFDVLHGVNGKDFSVISTVSGNNNSDQQINYSYTDVKPAVGTNYYQLNQVDFDGTSEKSNIVAVDNVSSSNAFTVSADENQITLFSLSNKNASAKLVITDMSGRVVLSKEVQISVGNNSNTIEISKLPSGVYTASLTIEKSMQTAKFTK